MELNDVALPGEMWFPENLNAAADGTIYVGSIATGQVASFKPGDRIAKILVASGTAAKTGITGLLVDEETSTLLACANDFRAGPGNAPASVYRFSLTDGSRRAEYPFGGNSICNDLAFDAQRNLYMTDSTGKIFRLPKGAADGTEPSLWASSPLFNPAEHPIGIDGIAFDGTSAFYVNTVATNRLIRVPVNEDGTSSEPQEIAVQPPLNQPDGMRLVGENTLIIAEAPANRVSRVVVNVAARTGAMTVIANQLDHPASVIKVDDILWVAEGQIDLLFANPPVQPNVPFYVRHVQYIGSGS